MHRTTECTRSIRFAVTTLVVCCALVGTVPQATAQKARYLVEIKAAAEKGWRDLPVGLQRWRENPNHSILWGYNSPPQPLYLAGVYAYLYKVTGEEPYAERGVALLAAYGDLRQTLPAGFEATRAEYEQGVPSVSNFFYLPPYVRAIRELKGSAAFRGTARDKIERDLAESMDFVFRFPNGDLTTARRCVPKLFSVLPKRCRIIRTAPAGGRWRWVSVPTTCAPGRSRMQRCTIRSGSTPSSPMAISQAGLMSPARP